MTKLPPESLTTTRDAARVWKGNIFLDPLHLALCVAALKHLLLTILLLGSVHSYCVSSQAKILQMHFWILVKNFFFLGYQHLTLCLTVPKLLFLALFFFWCWVLFNLPLCKLSMISTSSMVSLSPARFVLGD